MAMPETRQQVVGGCPPDVLVPEGDAVGLLDEDARGQGFLEAGSEVRIQGSVAVTRPGRRSGRESVGRQLERGGGRGQLVAIDRPTGKRHEAQDAPALGAVAGEPGDHDIREGADHRRVGQLPSGGQQLLGDERQSARAIGDEDEGGGGRTLALDRLDELGQLCACQGRNGDPGRPAIAGRRHLGDGPGERVVAGDLVGLPGPDEAHALGPADPAAERHERPAPGIGVVEVLDDEEDRLALGEPADDTKQGLEDPPLASLEGGRGRAIGQGSGSRQAPDRLREEADDILGGGPGETSELRIVDAEEQRPEGADDRTVRLVRSRPIGAAPDDDEGVVEACDPAAELGDEPGDADAAEALEEDRRGNAIRCRLERRGEPNERRLAPHEPRVVHRRGHERHSRRPIGGRMPSAPPPNDGPNRPRSSSRCTSDRSGAAGRIALLPRSEPHPPFPASVRRSAAAIRLGRVRSGTPSGRRRRPRGSRHSARRR